VRSRAAHQESLERLPGLSLFSRSMGHPKMLTRTSLLEVRCGVESDLGSFGQHSHRSETIGSRNAEGVLGVGRTRDRCSYANLEGRIRAVPGGKPRALPAEIAPAVAYRWPSPPAKTSPRLCAPAANPPPHTPHPCRRFQSCAALCTGKTSGLLGNSLHSLPANTSRPSSPGQAAHFAKLCNFCATAGLNYGRNHRCHLAALHIRWHPASF